MNQAPLALARSQIYGFLSLVYREEPSEALLHYLGRPEIRSAFVECNISLPEIDGDSTTLVEELAIEFSKLFIIPEKKGGVSPHESVYADSGKGFLWGDETVDVKKFIETLGLSLEDTPLLPDHVAIECEVLQKLTAQESETWKSGDTQKAQEYLKAEYQFLKTHLGRWFPLFAEKVEKVAQKPFYLQMTSFAKGFIEMDLEDINKVLT